MAKTFGAKDRAVGMSAAALERVKKAADTRRYKDSDQKRKIDDERAATAGRRAARM